MTAGDTTQRWSALLDAARATDVYVEFAKLGRSRKALLRDGVDPQRRRAVRIALMGTANASLLADPLALALECLGIVADIHVVEYGTFAHEAFADQSVLSRAVPDVVWFVNSPRSQPEWPALMDAVSAVDAQAARVADYWLDLCRRLNERLGCVVVFDNFHPLDARPHGNYSAKLAGDANVFLQRVNTELAQRATPYVHVHDVDWLASFHGIKRFYDPRFWYHAKQSVSFECLVPYVKSAANVIAAAAAASRKVLVLDLDNTLWGGVIGDDGLDGIRIGQGTAEGEAFLAFQQYVLELKKRGVLLAVCSKNEESNARLPFEKHPEMALSIDDFVAFHANWQPKPDNLRRIAEELNLGVDSFVFVDDNPAERQLMRLQLPSVLTIELAGPPESYVRAVDCVAPFEITSLSNEDAQRTAQYRENSERERLMTSVGDYRAYLESLAQQARIGAFPTARLDRITQLVNKTNQFNVTTTRMTRSDVDAAVADPGCVTLAVELADRFGDNGLIGVTIARVAGDALRVDTWLMSCRVLKRDVEKLVCNNLVAHAQQRGLALVEGRYIPTERNTMVEHLYAELGFECTERAADGATTWRLATATYEPYELPMEVFAFDE